MLLDKTDKYVSCLIVMVVLGLDTSVNMLITVMLHCIVWSFGHFALLSLWGGKFIGGGNLLS